MFSLVDNKFNTFKDSEFDFKQPEPQLDMSFISNIEYNIDEESFFNETPLDRECTSKIFDAKPNLYEEEPFEVLNSEPKNNKKGNEYELDNNYDLNNSVTMNYHRENSIKNQNNINNFCHIIYIFYI